MSFSKMAEYQPVASQDAGEYVVIQGVDPVGEVGNLIPEHNYYAVPVEAAVPGRAPVHEAVAASLQQIQSATTPHLPRSASPLEVIDAAQQRRAALAAYQIPKRPVVAVTGLSDSKDSGESDGEENSPVSSLWQSSQQGLGRPVSSASGGSVQCAKGLSDPVMYDPLSGGTEEDISPEQAQFLRKYFVDVDYSKDLVELIKSECPAPSLLEARRHLDREILDMLPQSVSTSAKTADKHLVAIERRLNVGLGPLTQLWTKLIDARRAVAPVSLNAIDLCKLVEQTIIGLGQTKQLVTYTRRTEVLSRFMRDNQKVKDVVDANHEVFSLTEDKLFGEAFYVALHRKAKGSKYLREAKQELGYRSRGTKRFKPNGRGGYSGPPTATATATTPQPRAQQQPAQQQPFRRGPPPAAKRGGRGGKAKRYVLFANNAGAATHFGSEPERAFHRPCRGQVNFTPGELGENHIGQMGVASSEWVPDRVGGITTPDQGAIHTELLKDRVSESDCRSAENVRKWCDREILRRGRSVCGTFVPEAKERWVTATCVQPETSQCICQIRTFQNGRHSYGFGPNSEQRLASKDRLERCLFCSEHGRTGQEVPEIPVGSRAVSVQVMPFRLGVGAPDVHKALETGHGSAEKEWGPGSDFLGRHDLDQSRQDHVGVTHSNNSVVAGATGIYCELREIPDRTSDPDGISGVLTGHKAYGGETAPGESTGNQTAMSGTIASDSDHCESLSQGDRQIDGGNPGNPARSIALQATADAKSKSFAYRQSELRVSSDSDARVQSGARLVGALHRSVEWPNDDKAQPRSSSADNDGCLQERLGCRMARSDNTGCMVRRRAVTTYQCVGTEECLLCPESIHKTDDGCACASESGQHVHSVANKQDGGTQVRSVARGNSTAVGLLSVEEDHAYSRTLARAFESGGGHAVSNIRGLQQLAADARGVQTVGQKVGTLSDRLVCRPAECTSQKVCELETGPRGMAGGRVHNAMAGGTGLRISAILPDWQMSGQSAARQRRDGAGDSGLADPTLVPTGFGNVDGFPGVIATGPKLVDRAHGQDTSIDARSANMASGMENLRQQWRAAGLSEQASGVLENARRPGTKSAYNSPWGKYVSWCAERQIDPFQSSVADVVNFLAEKHQGGLEYSTLNVYRSAISAYHPPVDGVKVGQHPLIQQFMKGAFNMRPPQPKYNETWDVGKVLQHIKTLGKNEDMSLKDLTLKMTMLAALTTANRAHELSSLNPKGMIDKGDSLVFTLTKLTKSAKPGRPPIKITWAEYELDRDLDVVACARQYIDRTAGFRVAQEQQEQLLLSHCKPHGPVVTCTVSRWLKELMSQAGIDTTVFKGHSVRGAATSKAKALGLSTEQILARANWKGAATFYKFYCRRGCMTDEFQSRVLQL